MSCYKLVEAGEGVVSQDFLWNESLFVHSSLALKLNAIKGKFLLHFGCITEAHQILQELQMFKHLTIKQAKSVSNTPQIIHFNPLKKDAGSLTPCTLQLLSHMRCDPECILILSRGAVKCEVTFGSIIHPEGPPDDNSG